MMSLQIIARATLTLKLLIEVDGSSSPYCNAPKRHFVNTIAILHAVLSFAFPASHKISYCLFFSKGHCLYCTHGIYLELVAYTISSCGMRPRLYYYTVKPFGWVTFVHDLGVR